MFPPLAHPNPVSSVAISPDGKQLATTSGDKLVKIWDAVSGQRLYSLSGHTDRVLDAAYSSNGKYLASTGEDGTVRLYVLDPGELVKLARTRLTRSLTAQECLRYLSQERCSQKP
ncbi:MAG: hypothetical protein AB1801_20250 [Chloroflexota bacterium]